MELIIYLLGTVLLPLIIILKIFKVQGCDFNEDKQLIGKAIGKTIAKSFSNVGDLKIIYKKIQIIIILSLIIACSELTTILDDVGIKVIISCLLVYLVYQSSGARNDVS